MPILKLFLTSSEVKARKGRFISIVNEGDTIVSPLADRTIEIPVVGANCIRPLLSTNCISPLMPANYICPMLSMNCIQPLMHTCHTPTGSRLGVHFETISQNGQIKPRDISIFFCAAC